MTWWDCQQVRQSQKGVLANGVRASVTGVPSSLPIRAAAPRACPDGGVRTPVVQEPGLIPVWPP